MHHNLKWIATYLKTLVYGYRLLRYKEGPSPKRENMLPNSLDSQCPAMHHLLEEPEWQAAYIDYHCPNCSHALPCSKLGHPFSIYFPMSERARYKRGEITEYDPRQGHNPISFLRTTNSIPLWSVRTLDWAYLEYDTRRLNYIRGLPQESTANQRATHRCAICAKPNNGTLFNFQILGYRHRIILA